VAYKVKLSKINITIQCLYFLEPLNSGAVLVADVYLRSGRPGGPAFGVRVGGCTTIEVVRTDPSNHYLFLVIHKPDNPVNS